MRAVEFLLGRRLANRDAEARRIGAFEGVPALGLDALGSTAYGPEAALSVLMPLGIMGLPSLRWAMLPVVILLVVLCASYWQTIRAYPNSGGAYIVVRDNLGTGASLLAAAALMIDYVLNVAVGISAGVAALVSAEPALHGYVLVLCLGILALITLVNLRGTLESGRLLALPVYAFIASFAAILGAGVYKCLVAGGQPQALIEPPDAPAAVASAGIWLFVRAVASGCTAMTGIEAVSNGVGAFREPTVRFAHRTLFVIAAVLGSFLIAIAYVAPAYRVAAMDETQDGYQSVLSQIAGAVAGHGTFYYAAMASLLCVLALSANTSFTGFPRLCRIVAEDGFLPKSFAVAGRRLVFSAGLVYLSACAGVLLLVFDGITNRLIPLFAIGAFLSFTLSQTGMVLHWHRATASGDRRVRKRAILLAINAAGATITAAALVVIVIAKFAEGAWITLLVVPAVIFLLRAIRRYYDRLEHQASALQPLQLQVLEPPIVLVTIDEINSLAMQAIALGLSLSNDVMGVHLTHLRGPDSDDAHQQVHERWKRYIEPGARAAGVLAPRLIVLPAQRRMIHEPVLKVVGKIAEEFPQRRVMVMIPELVKRHWYQYLLHTHRARALRKHLLRHGDERLTIASVPWRMFA